MVDAAIGGKTALNHAGAKNIVGAFYQPRAVVADVSTLATLPHRELVEGFGEVVKHAFIRDTDLLALLEDRLEDLLALDADLMTELVARNIEIKAEIVSADEREAGTRELLNFGHTLGHAFEAAGGYEALLHGEAVSAGMMAAAEIGRRTGVTPDAVVERLASLIDRAGMALRPPAGLDPERVKLALSLDKKIIAGGQRWVLLEEIGRPIVTDEVPADLVEAVVGEFHRHTDRFRKFRSVGPQAGWATGTGNNEHAGCKRCRNRWRVHHCRFAGIAGSGRYFASK